MTTTETNAVPSTIEEHKQPALEPAESPANEVASLDIPEQIPCEMEFTVLREDLLNALSLVIKSVGFSHTLPLLSHVLVTTHAAPVAGAASQVLLTCTNLETSMSASCAIELVREGGLTLPARPLLECIKQCPKGKRITIAVEEPFVHLRCGKRLFKLKRGADASEFPTWQELIVAEGAPCVLDAGILRQAIKEVVFVADPNDTSPEYTAACLHLREQTLTLVAIDHYHMAVRTLPLPTAAYTQEERILVPATSLRLLAEVLPHSGSVIITWDTDKKQAIFQAGQVQTATQLVDAIFPEYQAVLPTTFTASFTVPRKDLDQMVKAFKAFAQDNANVVTFSYHPEEGTVSCLAESQELGEASDELQVPVEGEAGRIMFDIRHLSELLKHASVDAFVFKLTKEDRPGMILPAGREDYHYVLMPKTRSR